MLGLARKLVSFRWIALAASVGVMSWQMYVHFWPEPKPLDQPRSDIAQLAAWEIVDQLPSDLEQSTLLIPTIQRDKTGDVVQTLRQTIKQAGKFSVLPTTAWESFQSKVGMDLSSPANPKEAVELARNQADYVLFIQLNDFISNRSDARLYLTAQLWDVTNQLQVLEPIKVKLPEGTRIPYRKISVICLLWLLLTALMPWLTYPLIRHILKTESNPKIFMGLMGYAILGCILALSLLIFNALMAGIIYFVIAAFVVTFGYCYWVFSTFETRRTIA